MDKYKLFNRTRKLPVASVDYVDADYEEVSDDSYPIDIILQSREYMRLKDCPKFEIDEWA